MTRILVVEDEDSFSDPLSYLLRREGYDVAVADDGPTALEEFDRARRRPRPARPHAAGAARAPRSAASCAPRGNVPVIMLTAKDGEIDKVVGLELGADDYVTKPYSSRELVARVRAVLRRGAEPEVLVPATVEAGPVRMDVERHVVTVGNGTVAMPLKEFELLEILLRNAGRVLTRMQLIDRVWGSDYVGDTKTLDVHVKRLRRKIEPDPASRDIWSRCAAWATSSRPEAVPQLVGDAVGRRPACRRRTCRPRGWRCHRGSWSPSSSPSAQVGVLPDRRQDRDVEVVPPWPSPGVHRDDRTRDDGHRRHLEVHDAAGGGAVAPTVAGRGCRAARAGRGRRTGRIRRA